MKIAIVGAGLMGRWHMYTARRLGADVVGIVDVNETSARALAARAHGVEVFSSIDALFSACSPDVVHVCTPLQTHKTLCEQILDRGAHIVCEKPLAGSAADVRKLYEVARKNGKKICPVHQFAFQNGVRKARKYLGKIGKPVRIDFLVCSAGADGQSEAEKNAVVADVLPHPFSVMTALWPDTSIANLDWQMQHPMAGEVGAQCLFDGVPLSMTFSMSAKPTRCRMEIRGDRGTLLLDFFHGYCLHYPGKVSRYRKMIYPFSDAIHQLFIAGINMVSRLYYREPAYPGLKNLLGDFYHCIEDGTEEPVPEGLSISQSQAREAFLDEMKTHQ
ncbi:MAG: Gfo/Idh/MocA family oxidoreductase [Marinobacter sp.]|uniref:Gfo/Idh/MocA family protein n=1 Tax=Marinobacter sp. TaxID=50741 RepID=UPI001B457145|nr:Gfo/Idh/MocA family oxidoreductase [Marinobacter sp.]MBQ0745355.1 Gfo/Idh/MocA family oxidoreductase [Marinobacter sp.]MBQ0816156.1 Gfo/Idh/MocA family oxidoreductase [Marinobacter sp.]